MVQKRPVPGSSGASLAKRPHLESRTETHASGKKSAGGSVSSSSADTWRKGGYGDWDSRCFAVLSPLTIFICSFSGWYAFQFLDQWRSITSNRFVLNMAVSLPVLLILGGREAMGIDTPDVLQSSAHSPSSSAVFQVGMLFSF